MGLSPANSGSQMLSGTAGGDLTGTYPNPTVANTATITPKAVAPAGLTGAVAASRYVGATASGSPVAGTFAIGDYIVDQQGRMWFCITAGTPGTWVSSNGLVYSVVLGADAATLDTGANAIPATGTLIEIYATLRTDEAAASSTVQLNLNGDGGANYQYNAVRNLNTTVTGLTSLTATGGVLGGTFVAGDSAGANVASVARMSIPSYAATTFYKAGMIYTGLANSAAASSDVGISQFVWRNTAAVNQVSLAITSGAGQKFRAGSAMVVYIR